MDTPDLGPVRKLGMGRRTGAIVVPPKAASELPAFDGGDSLAAEFGASSSGPGFAEQVGASAAAADAKSAANGNGAAGADDDKDVVIGGMEVDQTAMEGVSEEQLAILATRCKRRRKAVTS